MSTHSRALARALEAAASLKSGSWVSVEALALLAEETRDAELLAQAQRAAAGLRGAGTWEAVRALALLARAERVLTD
ncbi:MAG: hypothetical protein Q4G43_13400 [Mobilicoccus sp.]|nr:hypothetical protein [Mobilicoccus sp.]